MEHPENNEAYKGLVVNAGIEQNFRAFTVVIVITRSLA